jgi:RNA polymerase sigma factor (sigma-70 family)
VVASLAASGYDAAPAMSENREPPIKFPKDYDVARRALEGDNEAGKVIAMKHQEMLVRVLMARGVKHHDAEDVVADVISECFGARKTGTAGRALLESYEGRSALSTWMVTATWNRWLDAKRRDKYRGELPRFKEEANAGGDDPFERLPDDDEKSALDKDLESLMRSALDAAFASLDAEALLILKLVYQHRVSQELIAMMWQSNQSRISRTISNAREQIRRVTLETINERDPRLSLQWEDFLELCQASSEPLF